MLRQVISRLYIQLLSEHLPMEPRPSVSYPILLGGNVLKKALTEINSSYNDIGAPLPVVLSI